MATTGGSPDGHHAPVITGEPSATAWSAAAHRAAHQILDGGRIHRDPLALRILGDDADRAVELGREPGRRPMRLFIAARHRVAEDAATAAVAAGSRQVVVLGAGLDTFAYRPPFTAWKAGGVEVVEIDHPDTQAWKRQRLRDTGIAVPAGVRYAAVDLESTEFGTALTTAGVDGGARPVVLWLGVVPYLSRPAVLGTLEALARIPDATVIFDYPNPTDQLSGAAQERHARRAATAAALGEPWLTFFDSVELTALLDARGWRVVDHVGPREIAVRWLGAPADTPRRAGGHIVVATSGQPAA